jgi:hypothetical protein
MDGRRSRGAGWGYARVTAICPYLANTLSLALPAE